MTTTKLIGLLAALAAGCSAFGQTAPENPAVVESSGVLGFRYAEASFGVLDVKGSDTDIFGTTLTVNVPVASNIDVAFDYTRGWLEGDWNTSADSLNVTGLYFIDAANGLKPFGGVSLGYTWGEGDDFGTWGAVAGLEYQINTKVSVSASVGYDDDFEGGEGAFDGTVIGRYFFTRQLAGLVGVSYLEGGEWGYTAGVTYKF